MRLDIYVGHVKRGDQWKPLKLGDKVTDADTIADQTRFGLRVIRCVAVLSAKEAGKRRTKTYTLRTNSPNLAGEDIKKAFAAEAQRWKEKILNGAVKPKGEQEEIGI